MTQTTVREVNPGTSPIIPVPRPRQAELASEQESDAVASVREVGDSPAGLDDSTATQDTATTVLEHTSVDTLDDVVRLRARPGWVVAALDLLLALIVAVGVGPVLGLPLIVSLVAAATWPLLLLAAGHYGRRALGDHRARRAWSAGWTGARACVIVLAAAPWLSTIDPLALAELVVAFVIASGTHSLLAQAERRHRVVLAGRPRDVREALLELEPATGYHVVAACLTRAAKEPLVRQRVRLASAWPNGDGCSPAATRPAKWAMSTNRIAPTSSAMARKRAKSRWRG